MLGALSKSLQITVSLCLVVLWTAGAQQRFVDREGVVVFEASEKFFEEVKAKNESVTAVLDVPSSRIASLALIRGFHFKNKLMEEHFNENYIESDLHPKATFKGQIMGFDIASVDETSREFMIEGTLEVRGVAKVINPKVAIQLINNVMSIQGSFKVVPGDFDIKIPKIVENKIAKEVTVKLDFKLEGEDGD